LNAHGAAKIKALIVITYWTHTKVKACFSPCSKLIGELLHLKVDVVAQDHAAVPGDV